MNKKYAAGFASPEILISTLSTGKVGFTELQKSISKAFTKADCIEIMTHPATDNSRTYLDRRGEYELWKSEEWKEYIRSGEVELIPYSRLPVADSIF